MVLFVVVVVVVVAVPFLKSRTEVNAVDAPPIEAVLIFYWPNDWAMELQVVSDVLAGGQPLGSGVQRLQRAELWSSNPDFLWQALTVFEAVALALDLLGSLVVT